MGDFQLGSPAVGVHPDRRDAVQAQEDQVHEVILRKGFFLEMGVNQAQASQTPAPSAAFGEVRNEEGAGTADQHRFDRAIAGDEEPELAAALKGESRQVAC